MASVTVRGEIVDSKCFLGVMVPGSGKTHKDCASLCLRGGIPPALFVQDRAGDSALMLLTGSSGEPIGARALQIAGEAVEMTGMLQRQGGWLVLRRSDSRTCRAGGATPLSDAYAVVDARNMMSEPRPLNIPVILGTSRKGRASVHAANLIADLLNRRAGVRSAVIDIASVPLPVDDAGEAIKSTAFSAAIAAADGLVIVAPEYNHSFPGLLKHALDSCLSEYIHKAVGLVGVSAGPFAGIRVVQSLLPVMRELGLVTHLLGHQHRPGGEGLRRGRTSSRRGLRATLGPVHPGTDLDVQGAAIWTGAGDDRRGGGRGAKAVPCPECGTPMTHHADKVVPAAATAKATSSMAAARACSGCGAQQATLAPAAASELP